MKSDELTPLLPDSCLENGQMRFTSRRNLLWQIFLGLIANIGCLSPGMTLGFSAVAIPQMMNPNATFHIDENQASWMASLASLSTAVGCLISGSLMDHLGRRTALLTLNIPCVIGWILITFAYGEGTMILVYAGRVLTGLATGMSSSPPPVYSAEISSEKHRGMLVTWTSISISLGILIVYVLGTVIQNDWRLIAGVCAVFPLISFALTYFFLPESPIWLTRKGRHEDAAIIWRKLRGSEQMNVPTGSTADEKSNIFKSFFTASTMRPFLIMNLFFFFQQFSGTFVIVFYAIDIVKEAGVSFDPYLVAILIGVTRFIVTICVSFISNRYGRRPPSIVSGAGMTLCMGSLATFLYLSTSGGISPETVESMSWFPVVSIILYILTSTIGFLTLPWAMVGEVYPVKVRGMAAGLTTFFAYFFNFIIIKLYPFMLSSLQRYGLFFFYGGISVVGTIFVVFFLPETKGKNLNEIEEQFKRKSKRDILDIREHQPLQHIKTNENT